MNDAERDAHWQWCRTFIDHNCIFRSPPGRPLLVSPWGGLSMWQFYMQAALLNGEFAYRVALLFWDRFGADYSRRPFQICGCESGGVALISALQSMAYNYGVAVNVFMIKQAAKTYGLKNWLEGTALEKLPVMMADDIIAHKRTLTEQSQRIAEFGLELYPEAFAVVSCKLDVPGFIEVGEQKINCSVLFHPRDFVFSQPEYAAKYGARHE